MAVNDSYTTAEDTALNVAAPGVLANDTDADSNPLTAVMVTGPAHGTLTLNADGSFTYTPAANYYGQDSFTYKANDGTADSNVATVSITVNPVNDAPTLDGIGNVTINQDAGLQTVNLSGISSGAANEAQTLTVTAISSNPALDPQPDCHLYQSECHRQPYLHAGGRPVSAAPSSPSRSRTTAARPTAGRIRSPGPSR